MANVAAGEGLAQHQNIRQHHIGHKAVARAAKAGGNFVKDQQHIVLAAQLTGALQKRNVIHLHTARALQQRLYDKAVEPVVVFFKGLLQRRDRGRNMHHALFFVKGEMIILVVPHFHGFKGVAVVGALQRQHQRALAALVHIVLQRHFQRYFHRHAAGIRKEAIVQIAGQKFLQLLRKLLHRLVGKAAQHHMAEFSGLLLNGGGQLRVLIAVDHAPPRGNRVDQLLVGGVQIHAVGVDDLIGGGHGFHLRIRIPDHCIVTSSYKFASTPASMESSVSPGCTLARTGSPVSWAHMAMLSSSMVLPG